MMSLSELEQDALTEIFNIGVGIAAAAIYELTGIHVPVSVPEVELTSKQLAKHHFVHRESRQLCEIRQTYKGEFTTDAVLMFPEESRLHLVRMMVGSEFPDDGLADVSQDAMGELGNIVLNAVISNLASSLSMRLDGSLPVVNQIHADDLFAYHPGGSHLEDQSAPVLAVLIDFELSAQSLRGYLAFLLDAHSTQLLLSKLAAHIAGLLPP